MSQVNEKELREKHLVQVRTLCQQISSAISAIERSDLGQLRASVAAQETLCQEINSSDWEYPALSSSKLPTSEQSTLIEEIRALAQLNRLYGAVLRRSQRSCSLIANLYHNFGRIYGKDRSPVEHHTWSCEG
ncbi:MAG TPA: hypothetical protein VEI49_14680 [Terriglobales bacterium]|nr:hypothetical protein [Terriglobales bacterium]HXY14398.1 hypothetical protein [Terriglobales bacterium]